LIVDVLGHVVVVETGQGIAQPLRCAAREQLRARPAIRGPKAADAGYGIVNYTLPKMLVGV
jgi:hypothetical protein